MKNISPFFCSYVNAGLVCYLTLLQTSVCTQNENSAVTSNDQLQHTYLLSSERADSLNVCSISPKKKKKRKSLKNNSDIQRFGA